MGVHVLNCFSPPRGTNSKRALYSAPDVVFSAPDTLKGPFEAEHLKGTTSGPVHMAVRGGKGEGVRAHLPRALRTQVLSVVEIVRFLSSAIN